MAGIPDLNTGALAPVADELVLTDLPVRGQIPTALSGTLVRNGPNPFSGAFSGQGMLNWWPEAAMLHGISFASGQPTTYRNRWIRSRGWACHFEPDTSASCPEANPNVNVVRHAGVDLALAEGGPPVEIDAMLGTGAVPTALAAGLTAHPKIDPISGEMIWFRASWADPYLVYGVSDRQGQVSVEQTVPLPGPAMMHDMAVTERYSLLLDLNVAYDLTLFEHGLRIPIRWFDERSARIGVLPRAGGEVRWFPVASCFIQHVANAFEAGEDRIVLDAVRYRRFLELDEAGADFNPNPLGQLWRYEIDLGTGSVGERQICAADVEMPRINEAHVGRAHRFVYGVLQPTDQEMRGVVKIDVGNQRMCSYQPPPGDQNSEPVFVADPARYPEEDGGWLLFCVYRAESHTSDVVILDAQNMAEVAVVSLPVRIPAGFHGAWLPDQA